MSEFTLALLTCGSRAEAGQIAETLVGERLAACVNVLSNTDSCYRWDGKVNWDTECLLVIKTTAAALDRVRKRVLALHSYDVPEFIALSIDSGSEPYLKWIADSVD